MFRLRKRYGVRAAPFDLLSPLSFWKAWCKDGHDPWERFSRSKAWAEMNLRSHRVHVHHRELLEEMSRRATPISIPASFRPSGSPYCPDEIETP